jgi:hypothetical protein
MTCVYLFSQQVRQIGVAAQREAILQSASNVEVCGEAMNAYCAGFGEGKGAAMTVNAWVANDVNAGHYGAVSHLRLVG